MKEKIKHAIKMFFKPLVWVKNWINGLSVKTHLIIIATVCMVGGFSMVVYDSGWMTALGIYLMFTGSNADNKIAEL